MKLKILDWLWLRMLLVLLTLFFCWYFSIYYVLHRHGDIAVTYWSQGIYVIPVIVFAFVKADKILYKNQIIRNHNLCYMLLSCSLAILLYFPAFFIFIQLLFFFSFLL